MSEHLSQRKAAAYLGILPSTLSAYAKSGRAPRPINLHGVRYFDVEGLDAWLAARTVEGAQ